jgi:4-hydroxy-tetrahydrodipicolinate synthase
MRLGCAGLIPAPDACDVLARVYDLFRKGDEASVAEAERLHADVLPLLTYVMASPEHMLCYGKRLWARRIGLEEVHPRHPCVLPNDFGTGIVARYSAGLLSLAL